MEEDNLVYSTGEKNIYFIIFINRKQQFQYIISWKVRQIHL